MKGLNIKISSYCLIGQIKTNANMSHKAHLKYKDAKVNRKGIEKMIETDIP